MKMLPLLAAVFAALSPAARADLRIAADVTRTTERAATANAAAAPSPITNAYASETVIGKDFFTYTTPEQVTHADFAARKLYHLDRAKKTFVATSLYSTLGFRVSELPNRIMLQQVTAKAGVKELLFDAILTEHLFGLHAPTPSTVSPDTASSEKLAYTHGTKPLMSCTLKGQTLQPAEAASFVRFLRYIVPMHPDILAALEERKTVPDELDIHHYDVGRTEHYHIVVTKVETVSSSFDLATTVAGYEPAASPVDALCAGRHHLTAAEFERRCRELLDSAAVDGEAKRSLDCLLATLAYGLSHGEQQVETLRRFKADFRSDPQCTAVLGSINPKESAAALKAAAVLHTLEPHTKYPEVLQIFAANDLTVARKYEEAIALFTTALQANPCITGAWKDLGDLYYLKFDAVSAWACWDTGRLFASDHPQFKPVTEFEQKLRRDHPEFF